MNYNASRAGIERLALPFPPVHPYMTPINGSLVKRTSTADTTNSRYGCKRVGIENVENRLLDLLAPLLAQARRQRTNKV